MKKLILLLLGIAFLMPATDALAQKKKDKKAEVSFEEFMSTWVSPRVCSDADLNIFCQSTNDMLVKYKKVNENINFIKIESTEIPDSGDGVTTQVKITDGEGNDLTTAATLEKFGAIALNLGGFVSEVASAVQSGQNIVSKISSDPANALRMAPDIKQAKKSIDALVILSKELPKTVTLVDQQIKTLKSAKQN